MVKKDGNEQTITMRCSAVVLAFGCTLSDSIKTALAPLELEWGLVKVICWWRGGVRWKRLAIHSESNCQMNRIKTWSFVRIAGGTANSLTAQAIASICLHELSRKRLEGRMRSFAMFSC